MMVKFCITFSFLLAVSFGAAFADWNILNHRTRKGMKINLKNYCEAWKMNVELHNIQKFEVVPEECVGYVGKYMTSTQYRVDSRRAIEESILYLRTNFNSKGGNKEAWIFDIDDTLLSTLPYYKKHNFGGEKMNSSCLEEWMRMGKAPALEQSVVLFNELKSRGVDIILVSSRRESLRSATIDNLVGVGFHGWTSLFLRGCGDEAKAVQKYKADVRKQLMDDGYDIMGIVGDQFSSFEGHPSAKRTFKLSNPMYYVS